MANNEDKLSRLYREGLENFAKDPPPEVWAGIKQGLLIKNLVTLKFLTSMNIYSVSVFIAAAAISGFFIGKQLQHKEHISAQNKAVSNIVNEIPANTQEIKAEQSINYNNVIEESVINAKSNPKTENQSTNAVNEEEKPIPDKPPLVLTKPVNEQAITNEKISNSPEQAIEKQLTGNNDVVKEESSTKSAVADQQTKQNDQIDEKKKPEPEQVAKPAVTAKEITIPKKPKTGQGFYAEIFGAPSLVTYKFEESDVNPNLTFVEASKQNEEPALSYTAGLEFGYGLKNLFAQTGINYSDYRSKTVIDLVSTNSFWEMNLVLDSVYVPDSMNPHYDYFYDTLRVLNSQDTHVYHNANNSMRYLEIPIILGCRFYKNKFSYAFAGGVSFGYMTSAGGKTLNPDLKSVTSNTSESVPYKPWTIYLLFRAEGAYLLKNNLSIFVRPGFKYNLSSVFEDYYPVQKSFYALDLHLGLRYNF